MNEALVAFGSNLGDGVEMFRAAIQRLATSQGVQQIRASGLYATRPAGGPANQNTYVNGAFELVGNFTPADLFRNLKSVERELGRSEGTAWGPREIDLDLVWSLGPAIVQKDFFSPHVRMHQRWFVLRPLTDLRPEARHPVLQMTISEMLEAVQSPNSFALFANPIEADSLQTLIHARFPSATCYACPSPSRGMRWLTLGPSRVGARARFEWGARNTWIVLCQDAPDGDEEDPSAEVVLAADCRAESEVRRRAQLEAFLDSLVPGEKLDVTNK